MCIHHATLTLHIQINFSLLSSTGDYIGHSTFDRIAAMEGVLVSRDKNRSKSRSIPGV